MAARGCVVISAAESLKGRNHNLDSQHEIATALANLNITLVNHNVTSVTVDAGTNTGGLTSIIEPFNSATDCG